MTRPTMWNVYKMDADKEIHGVTVDFFGAYRVKIARAGGKNEALTKALEIHARPIRKALDIPGAVPKAQRDALTHNVYLDAVIKKFESNVQTDADKEPIWKEVILDEEGQERPVTRENLLWLFKELPDLFESIVTESQNLQLFRKEQLKNEAGN